jgi:GxxExxY protein
LYKDCLVIEMRATGLKVEVERKLPLVYRGVAVGQGYKVDLVVERAVVVEVKAVEVLAPVHIVPHPSAGCAGARPAPHPDASGWGPGR